MSRFSVGSLVRCREREWVVLPSPDDDLLLLRPLGGAAAEICGIFLPVEGDGVTEASFAPPDSTSMGDVEAGSLLRNAARLSLRSGAGPFRSLGHLGVRPRPYQLVPLIMALRLDPVRLLIADDVGIGKTIEAGLIVRELLDRGEISRLTVLCPPHLCDQWQRELAEKFALDATVVRSSTATSLERSMPRGDVSVWEHFPITVASIDYVKSDLRRDSFLRAAPDLVIVDEAHAAVGMGGSAAQQQRYALVRELTTAHATRHLLLLTATPHSGVEDAFTSLLGLLDPRFGQLDPGKLSEEERDALSRHFVQRRRGDVQRWLGARDVTPFPIRESAEVTYTMPRASAYRTLFDDVFTFTKELVQERGLDSRHRVWRQRARYWAALALLRCVMSSPAAAEKALRLRAETLTTEAQRHREDVAFEVDLLSPFVLDSTEQEQAYDMEPAHAIDLLEDPSEESDQKPSVSLRLSGEKPSDRARLTRFATRAAELRGTDDLKLQRLIHVVNDLLREGFNPIIYCRYIATADYVAAELTKSVGRQTGLRVLSVTGERSEEERETLIAELEASPRRLLVATDCLSEGINLQGGFDAVVHYDLPWNPNRLEQREGRVDRYGQRRPTVRTTLLYGKDNPMDEAVMKVLLRKAVRIHKTLGITVPLPVESGTVVEALIASLFQPTVEQMALFDTTRQMTLLDATQEVRDVETAWDRAVEREQESRTRFAQRRIKPEEVARELEESDAVLGDAAAVERFVTAACARMGAHLADHTGIKAPGSAIFTLPLSALPEPIQERIAHLPASKQGLLRVSFADPAPEGVESLGRNHPLVVALAEYLMETALAPEGNNDDAPVAARSGVVRTQAVPKRTRLLLLRVRMLIENTRQRTPSLAEELVVVGFRGQPHTPVWLPQPDALALLEHAHAAANLTPDERSIALTAARDEIPSLADELGRIAEERASHLRESHMRVRAQTGGGTVRVRPAGPPDVLGLYVLLPRMN